MRIQSIGRKSLFIPLVAFLLVTLSAILTAAVNPQPEPPGDVQVFVDGSSLTLDVFPSLEQCRTPVPLGVTVEWHESDWSITARKGDLSVLPRFGSKVADKNGTMVHDRALAPRRFVSEALETKVDWDGDSRTEIVWSTAGQSGQFSGKDKLQPGQAGNFRLTLPKGQPQTFADLAHRAGTFRFQAFSATKLLVSNLPGKPQGGSHQYVFGDGVFIDWNLPDRKWWFKWSNPLLDKDVSSVVWQVSALPFPADREHWQKPPGLVASGTLDVGRNPASLLLQDRYQFAIDFAQFALGLQNMPLRVLSKNVFRVSSAQGIAQTWQPQNVSVRVLTMPQRTYYVRVVLLDAQGRLAGPSSISTPRAVIYGEPEVQLSGSSDTKLMAAQYPGPENETNPYVEAEDFAPFINWNASGREWWFREAHFDKRASHVVWQVSQQPFPASGQNWESPRAWWPAAK